MSMSTRITAYTDPTNPDYLRHKKVLLACLEADVSLPKETAEYFGEDQPEEELLEAKLGVNLEENVHYFAYHGDGAEGFTVDITKLPKGVSKVRFTNRW